MRGFKVDEADQDYKIQVGLIIRPTWRTGIEITAIGRVRINISLTRQ